MAPPRASSRIGLFTLLLSVIAVSLFGSLIAADRSWVSSQRELAELDARSTALIVGRDLRLRAEALAEFGEPLLAPASSAPRPPDGFDPVWVLDSTGRLVFPPGARLSHADSSALAALARGTSTARWPSVGIRSELPGGVLLSAPVVHQGKRLGTTIGLLPTAQLVDDLLEGASHRAWVALEARDRVIASIGQPSGGDGDRRAAAAIPLPGERMQLAVVRSEAGRETRRVLWLLGVVALAALLAGLVGERRQTMALAGRTAELERLYQEVARSNRMKSEFLANVSHELRTPLNAIVGFVEMLREGVYGELNARQSLPVARIAASATHLRQLVDRLLDIAKIAAGRVELHLEPVALRSLVLNVASEMESLVAERGLTLSISVPAALPRVETDQTHLRQILINLLGNAVKYTPSGIIEVRATRIGGRATAAGRETQDLVGQPPNAANAWIALAVSDTGIGIAPDDQQRIFDEFEQVDAGPRTDSARRGTGLGLAISRRLARALGGDITVRSAPGQGSTFTVWLPLRAELEPWAEASAVSTYRG